MASPRPSRLAVASAGNHAMAQYPSPSKKLLSQPKVSSSETHAALNKLWREYEKPAAEQAHETKKQMKRCADINSLWVFRKTPVITKFYTIGSALGNPGQYGLVKSARRISDGKELAVKILSKLRVRNKKHKVAFFEDIRCEVHLLSATQDHPSIIECYEVFEDVQSVYLVMAQCAGGELFDRIQTDSGFCEKQASTLFRQMVSATYYIHQRGVAHCDMKPENFMFRSKDKDSPLVLIDFGMAKIVEWRKYYNRLNGTPYYIAGEVLDGHYNESCDMWSLGVILFIVVFGFPPFFDDGAKDNNKERDDVIYSKIRKGFTPKVLPRYGNWFPADMPVSSACRDLISRLLRSNVADRMTAEEALEHPWLRSLGGELNTSILDRNNGELAIFSPAIMQSLQSYKPRCALQSEILKILKQCNYLNASQMASVKEFFQIADKDKDGKISHQELFEALKTIDSGISLEETKSILHTVDANNDGFLDWDEFLSSRINRKLLSKEERLRKVFRALDLDNSGKISGDELKAALETITDRSDAISIEQCKQLIKDVDLNDDGEIDFEEFINMFRNM